MSPINQLSLLAFVAGALAVPGYRNLGHDHGHQHLHSSYKSGSAVVSATGGSYPFPVANATGIYGSTGTGFATGTSVPSGASSAGSATVSVVAHAVSASSSVAVSPVDVASSSSCTTDVTVTSTLRTYITVTASGTPSSSSEVAVEADSTSSDGPVVVYSTVHITLTSSSAFPSLSTYSAAAKGYRKYSRSSSSPSSTTSTSVYVAPTTSSTSTSVYVAPTTSSVAAYSSSTTVSSAASTATGTTGKRGLAYNDASLTSYFSGSQVSWAYNWGSATTGLASGLNYIPLLWGPTSDFTTSWSANAAAAIKSGSTYLMSFNEPDISSQANLTPEAAAAAYQTYMMPFAGQAKLCAPAVTNGGGSMGLTWLANFLAACTDCQIDCVSIHWYDSYANTDYFKEHVTNATTISGKEVFVSEFAPNDGTDADITTFLEDVMPWMDANDNVAGYAYFMVSNGILVSGDAPSSYGSTYMSYTS